jgi:hypothetical protein
MFCKKSSSAFKIDGATTTPAIPALGSLGGQRRDLLPASASQRVDGPARKRVEACAHHSTATATAAAPGVVLCVADRIVRIVVNVVAGEDLGGRLRRGIDRLIGVAAGEGKRCDHDRDAEPHGRFPTHWSRPVRRSFGRCAEKSAITRSVTGGGEPNKGGPSLLGRGLESREETPKEGKQ